MSTKTLKFLNHSSQPDHFDMFQQNNSSLIKPYQAGSVVQAIESIQNSYAPTRDLQTNRASTAREGRPNVDCEFATVMYNKRVNGYPQQDPLLFGNTLEKAEHENLDPENYYPVCEMGIDSLVRRIENQSAEMKTLEEHKTNILEIIGSVDQSNTQISTKVTDLKTRQANLLHKLLVVLRKVEILRCHGAELQQPELLYRERLLRILSVMQSPYHELQILSTKVTQLSQSSPTGPADQSMDSLAEEDLEFFCNALQKQREGLEYVTDVLSKDLRDVSIIRSHLKAHKEGSQQGGGDNRSENGSEEVKS